MTELTPAIDTAPRLPNLLQRIVGVIFSPRSTYTAIAARPAILGALAVVILLNGAISYWMLGSETGRRTMAAQAEQNIREVEAQGNTIPPEQRRATLLFVRYLGIGSAVAQVVFTPAVIALLAAIFMAVLNALYGGQASFRHVYAIVTHSWLILGIAGLFTTPLMLAKQELSSPSTVAVLLPMLPEDSFVTHFLGAIDFVWIWAIINLAIGLAVLYKRRTGPLATSLLVTYGVIALVIATARSVF
jgi:Yip1 domain